MNHESPFPTARRARSRPAHRSSPSPQDISPRLADAALAAKVDDRLVDLTYPLDADARVQIVTQQVPRRSRSTATRRRTCWPRP